MKEGGEVIKKEKRLLQSKMSNTILNPELLGLLTKFQGKHTILVKSLIDYKIYKFNFEFIPNKR